MPLGVRDVLLVIRARDQASRIVNEVGRSFEGLYGRINNYQRAQGRAAIASGAALVGLGAAVGALGAAGLKFFDDAKDAAVEYNKSAALTFTQVEKGMGTLKQVRQVALDVAKDIPAPLEQMQASLFDIFSSMDVNINQAKDILTGFSKAAVAGGTDVQTAGRATIAILNGFGLPISDLNKVLDVQFQLVRKGVGTYEEFASGIGRAIPSANRAGQSVEQLAGMMAFLTRVGLSVPMAATSAARALDALAKPKVADNMKKMGISVRDAAGEFRPMSDVMGELHGKLSKLSKPEQAAALDALFKGSGNNIQARRFFDSMLKNFDQYEARVKDMGVASGAMGDAFKIMAKEPANQSVLLKNNIQALRIEIGQHFIPMMQKVTAAGLKVIRWFDDLSPGVKKAVVIIFGLVSAFLLIAGTIMVVVGSLSIMWGMMTLVGISVGALMAKIALISVGLIALAVVVFLIIKHWDTLKRWAGIVWDFIKEKVSAAWEGIKSAAGKAMEFISTAWGNFVAGIKVVGEFLGNVLSSIAGFFSDLWQNFQRGVDIIDNMFGITKGLNNLWNTVRDSAKEVFADILTAIQTFASIAKTVWGGFVDVFKVLWEVVLKPVIQNFILFVEFLVTQWINKMSMLWTVAQAAFSIVQGIFAIFWQFIQAGWDIFLDILTAAWRAFGDNIITFLKNAWQFITDIIGAAFQIITSIFRVALNILTGNWSGAWNAVKDLLGGVWDGIVAIVRFAFQLIKNAFDMFFSVLRFIWDSGWSAVKNLLKAAWEGIKIAVSEGIEAALRLIRDLPGKILDALGNLKDLLVDAGKNIIKGLIKGIKDMIPDVGGVLKGLTDKLPSWKGPPERDKRILLKSGMMIMDGLNQGINIGAKTVERNLRDMTDLMALHWGNPETVMNKMTTPTASSTGGGINIAEGAIQITVQGDASPENIEKIRQVTDEALHQLMRTLRSR